MWHPEGVYFGWATSGGESPLLAVLLEEKGRLALVELAEVQHLERLGSRLSWWTRHDVDTAFCTDMPMTFDPNDPRGERRIDRLYRKLVPKEFEEGHWVASLAGCRTAILCALHGARSAHQRGIPISETHPRASLAWMGARQEGWRRAVAEYSAARCASEDTHGLPLGIVRQRCLDLWNGLLERMRIEDRRPEYSWPRERDIDAIVCAMAAAFQGGSRVAKGTVSGALFPWSAGECLFGARGTYVLLGRDPTGQATISSSPLTEPKRAA
jgi:hypothetical protein